MTVTTGWTPKDPRIYEYILKLDSADPANNRIIQRSSNQAYFNYDGGFPILPTAGEVDVWQKDSNGAETLLIGGGLMANAAVLYTSLPTIDGNELIVPILWDNMLSTYPAITSFSDLIFYGYGVNDYGRSNMIRTPEC